MQNHFSRLPPKSVARQEALWQDTLREGSVRALCQGREYNSSGLTCHLKRSSPRPQFYRSESPEIRRKEHSKKKLDNPAVFSVYSVHTEMSDNTKTSLTPVAQKFILHWGEMGTKWGINRTVAQVHALLFLSPKPLPADAISETLSVARSNVSTSLRELQGWGIVRVVHVLGDRRDHFESIK